MRFFSCSAKIVFQKKYVAEFPHFEKRTPDTLPYATGLKRATDPLPSKKFSFTKNALHNSEYALENLKKRSADVLPYLTGLKRAENFSYHCKKSKVCVLRFSIGHLSRALVLSRR